MIYVVTSAMPCSLVVEPPQKTNPPKYIIFRVFDFTPLLYFLMPDFSLKSVEWSAPKGRRGDAVDNRKNEMHVPISSSLIARFRRFVQVTHFSQDPFGVSHALGRIRRAGEYGVDFEQCRVDRYLRQ